MKSVTTRIENRNDSTIETSTHARKKLPEFTLRNCSRYWEHTRVFTPVGRYHYRVR